MRQGDAAARPLTGSARCRDPGAASGWTWNSLLENHSSPDSELEICVVDEPRKETQRSQPFKGFLLRHLDLDVR